jgi:hypothetical protein
VAKGKLPLPDLLRNLGFDLPVNGEGNIPSPFAADRAQKTPSFSMFQRNGTWGWFDRTGGGEAKGDEITFLEKLESLSRPDAIRRYLALAGVENAMPAPPVRKGNPSGNGMAPHKTDARESVPFDWADCVSKFTQRDCENLARWRGISPEFVRWLHSGAYIGIRKRGYAFPVHDDAERVVGAHVRVESGNWFYEPRGCGCRPLVIGNALSAEKTMCFESQWDAFAVMDAMGWHNKIPKGWLVLVTRGASNGRFASRAFGTVYAWPQNDPEKGGKRAGEEWMNDVASHAPAELFRVNTPAQYKDANDWARTEKMDAWASIGAAVAVEKATESKPAQETKKPDKRTGNGSHPSERPFDPAAVLDELGLYWLNGSASFFLKREDFGRVRFLEMGASEIRRKLKVRGFRNKPDSDSGETVSQIDRILDAATELRAVDWAVNIAGMKAGVYDLQGGRVLVRDSPRIIEPIPGEFRTIEEFLTGLLGEQVIRFCCWLKIGYEALRAGERRQGQALFIIGPPDCGKSRIQHQIITPILGGRSADPKSFFFGRTDFNNELIGSEHLLIEEIPSSNRHEDRQYFGEKLKEIVANETARLHKKNCDALTSTPFWRSSTTLNDDPEKLKCLPRLTDDLADKIIMLKANPAPDFWERFANAADPRKAFREAIEAELPAFAHYLVKLNIPSDLQSRRFGVKSFIPDDIAQTLFEGEPEHYLLLLIDKCLFPPTLTKPEPWEGDAEDLKQTLCAEGSSVRPSAIRLLGSYPNVCGQYLARLKSKFPARIERPTRKANSRPWRINPPAA